MEREDIPVMGRAELCEWLDALGAEYPDDATVEGLRDQLERTVFLAEGV